MWPPGGQPPPANDPPSAKWNYFYARPEAIASESSSDHVDQTGERVLVSGFGIDCWRGTRGETNGFGAWRTFNFGRSAGDAQNLGYELSKETDFTNQNPMPANLPFRHQTGGNHPNQIWDGRGILTQMSWESGHPADIHYADGSNCTYDWTNPGASDAPDTNCIHNTPYHHWLFKKKDERGQWTTYVRDARRRIKRIEYPDGSSEQYTYNDLNQVTTHTLPSGAIETFVYDGNHRLVLKYNSFDIGNNPQDYTEYTYDSLERVATMKDGLARERGASFRVQMTYNGRHQVTSVAYPPTVGSAPPTVRYEYDWYGNCKAIIDELGHRKDYTFDAYRRCISMTEQLDAPGWDGTGNVASRQWDWIYDRVIDGVAGTRSAFTHTSKEWRIQIEPVFNSANQRRGTSRTFDVNNRITSEQTGLIQLPGDPLGRLQPVQGATETHSFSYDQNGQKSSYTDPLQRVTAYQYDNRNRLWKSTEYPRPGSGTTARTTETLYNTAGNKTKVIFPDGKFQEWPDYGYTAFGQPRVFKDERYNTTNLEYWPWGPMKKLSEVVTHRTNDGGAVENQSTKFYYDPTGRPQTTIFPDTTMELSEYQFGQLSKWTTRRNQIKRPHYDVRGREDYHTWDNGAAPRIDRVWDDASRMTRIWNSFSTVDYGYDSAGQAKWEKSNVTGGNGWAQVTYYRFPSGEESRLVYPDTTTIVNPSYTVRGQLAGVGWPSGSTSYVYLLDGKVDYQARTNGVTTTYGYDGRGMIGWVRHTKGNNDLAKREYWRDERDRITAWKRGTDPALNQMEDGRGDRYGYDPEGQLTAASYRAATPEQTPSGALRTDSFVYDELGNRMGANRVANRGAVLTFSRRDNGLNQYLNWTPSAIYYDDNFGGSWVPPGNGVMMAEGWITASFNALNQPMAIWSQAYGSNFLWFGFDPLGRCVKRWTGTVTGAPVGSPKYFYYDGWNLVQEGFNATTADRSYVHGGRVDEIVASQVSGVWYNHHYDGQGNCILLSTINGGLQEQYDYDAFGFPYFYDTSGNSLPISSVHTRFLFTGREWLSDLRIYDYRVRQYQPELGRFLQPDPEEFGAGDYNLYRYCHNDPVNRSDPTGEIGWPGAAWGAIAGAASEVLMEGAENMLQDRSFFANLNYSHIGIAAAVGAGTGALGYGVATQGAKAINASKRVYHVRQVLAARRAAERAGKFRNALKTAKMQAEAAAKTREAALAAARGAAGPAVKRALDAALDGAGHDTDDKGEKQIEKK